MDVIETAKQIEARIKLIDDTLHKIAEATKAKVETSANYEKQLALFIVGLEMGKEYKLDDEVVKHTTATTIDKKAKGLAWKALLDMETAECRYKGLILQLESAQAQLNAYQSIFRHLQNTTENRG